MAAPLTLRGTNATLRGVATLRGAAAAIVVAVGQASETDDTQAVIGYQPSRALKITVVKTGVLGQAAETDTARSIANQIKVAVGQAVETELAQIIDAKVVRLRVTPPTMVTFITGPVTVQIAGTVTTDVILPQPVAAVLTNRADTVTLSSRTADVHIYA